MDAIVEDVPMGAEPVPNDASIHPSNLEEKEAWILMSLFNLVFGFLSSYGWYILFLVALLYVIKMKFGSNIENWLKRRAEAKEAAEYHKNPDKFIERESAVEEARTKMQEKYDQLAQEHKEKMKEMEEKKRQEALAKLEKSAGLSEKRQQESEVEKKNRSNLRPAFNPMMDGGPSRYRPSRSFGSRGG